MIILLLAVKLAACGFYLRTAESPLLAPLKGQQVFIEGLDTQQGFGQKLIAALRQAGAEPTTAAKQASLRLKLTQINEGKTATAFSATRQVREFNHFLDLSFTVESMLQAERSLTSSVHVERNQIYDSRYVLGVSEEERSIQAELQAEAARLLALRLAALVP
ncbi:hypothetical protein [Thiothrix eikelboomii]|uniref:LPS-assembly lipoprotein LptE n=1 Tax=Thiothrix eikelboomii TaxID=92487 RepID=UPI003BAE605E